MFGSSRRTFWAQENANQTDSFHFIGEKRKIYLKNRRKTGFCQKPPPPYIYFRRHIFKVWPFAELLVKVPLIFLHKRARKKTKKNFFWKIHSFWLFLAIFCHLGGPKTGKKILVTNHLISPQYSPKNQKSKSEDRISLWLCYKNMTVVPFSMFIHKNL